MGDRVQNLLTSEVGLAVVPAHEQLSGTKGLPINPICFKWLR